MLTLEAQPTLLVSSLSLPGSSLLFCTEYSPVFSRFSWISEISHTVVKSVIRHAVFSVCV